MAGFIRPITEECEPLVPADVHLGTHQGTPSLRRPQRCLVRGLFLKTEVVFIWLQYVYTDNVVGCVCLILQNGRKLNILICNLCSIQLYEYYKLLTFDPLLDFG